MLNGKIVPWGNDDLIATSLNWASAATGIANRAANHTPAPERYDAPFGALLYISVHQQIRAFSMPHLRLMRQQEGQQANSDHLRVAPPKRNSRHAT